MAKMTHKTRILLPLALLSGCVSAPQQPASSVVPVRPAVAQNPAGLESVMGRPAGVLVNRFGAPALDVREGQARKLQFSNGVCVLDLYLYPPSGGGEAVVTHVDARLPDGRDLDRASCLGSFRR
jgi:hypothetical protein